MSFNSGIAVSEDSKHSQIQFKRPGSLEIQPCFVHGRPIEFICNSKQCLDENNILLCKECLKQHKDHRWVNKEQYFSVSMRNIIEENPNINIMLYLKNMKEKVQNALDTKIIAIFNQRTNQIRNTFENSLKLVEQKNQLRRKRRAVSTNKLNREVMPQIRQLYEQQKKDSTRIKWISNILEASITHTGMIIDNILQLINYQMESKRWDDEQDMTNLNHQIVKYTKSQQIQIEKHFFQFSEYSKHQNIRLQNQKREAVYVHSIPTQPVAMANRQISESHNRVGFEIVRMKSVAFIFQCTTIFLGLCNPATVKVAGLRQINQMSKGAYLISSAGWSYHHKDVKYDRKDNVGWTFGEGDRIQIEVVFDQLETNSDDNLRTKVIFTKKGRLYDNVFEMPLKLSNEGLRKLKPCVSFDAQEDAIVRIYDIV